MKHILALPSFIHGVASNLKHNSIGDEIHMCFRIMGPGLYYKYMAGTAVPGVDFQ